MPPPNPLKWRRLAIANTVAGITTFAVTAAVAPRALALGVGVLMAGSVIETWYLERRVRRTGTLSPFGQGRPGALTRPAVDGPALRLTARSAARLVFATYLGFLMVGALLGYSMSGTDQGLSDRHWVP